MKGQQIEASERELQDLLARFDHEQFRPKQRTIIDAILVGRDTLAVLPTGSGKSLLYQLSSQILSGITVVVSPLIALISEWSPTVSLSCSNRWATSSWPKRSSQNGICSSPSTSKPKAF